MKESRVYNLIVILFISLTNCWGQADTVVFSLDEFIRIVGKNHPIAKAADLLSDQADAAAKMARGGFDPKIEGGLDRKSYDDKNYFTLWDAGLKIPTWFGVDIKATYERNSGEFLSNSDFLPPRGLWAAGISVPLGKGLLIDERRAMLQRADIVRQANEQERIMLYNEVIFAATLSYLNWQQAYNTVQILQTGVEITQQRFINVKASFRNGDVPAIDTLESLIAVQNRQQALISGWQDYENARIDLENYLWMDGNIPLELQTNSFPEALDTDRHQAQQDSMILVQNDLVNNHPKLQLIGNKINDLQITERLNREDLKPDLRVAYNPLLGSTEERLFGTFSANDFKLGVKFSYPILQRKERGKLQLTRLKIKETAMDRFREEGNINTKLDTYYNNQRALARQIQLVAKNAADYERLLQAEYRKLDIGESSQFLVNNREIKFLDSNIKLVKTKAKLLKNRYTYFYEAGNINWLYRQ